MRAFLALLAILVALPCASALGLTAPAVVVTVDAPLLAPLQVESPQHVETETFVPVATHAASDSLPAPAVLLTDSVDRTVHMPQVDLRVEPPRVLKDAIPASKLLRLDHASSPAPPRVPLAAPRALDASIPPRALPRDDATAPRVLSGQEGAAIAPRPAAPPAAPALVPPGRAPEPAWPALAAAGAALLAPLALALYHRLRGRAAARSSQTRRALLAQLAADPGASPTELARALGVDPSTAQYHLRRLEREGLAVTQGGPRAARWFPAGAHTADERARRLAERSGAGVLAAVRREPGRDKSALARELAISRATVAWHLAALERAGLVRYERAGRCVRVHPTSF